MGCTRTTAWLTSLALAAIVACGCTLSTAGTSDATGATGAGGSGGGGGGAAGAGGVAGAGGGGGCGDGTIQAGEECDDGNGTPADGCTTCVVDCIGTKDPTTFHCYRLIQTLASWSSAVGSCVGFGGHLATITSQSELEIAQGVVAQGDADTWIGATDAAMEDNFVWTTGEPWGFEAWAPNEPDGGNLQNCLFLSKNRTWLFNDFDCAAQFPYLCEWDPAEGD